jgi:phospholipid transport system transporter-binding protein
MPSADGSVGASVRREGDALLFSGVLDRAAAALLWPLALPLLGGIARFDLNAVSAVDSAGLALLGELAERSGTHVFIEGNPAGLAALRDAYRLDEGLGYAS